MLQCLVPSTSSYIAHVSDKVNLMASRKKIKISKWVIAIYSFSAIALVPWIVFLGANLPSRQIAHHWNAAWVGFDILMFVLAGLTALFAYRRSAKVIIAATSLATILLIDTWFDIVTAQPGTQQQESILFAAFIEIPLALLTFRLVYRTLAQVNWEKHKPIRVRK